MTNILAAQARWEPEPRSPGETRCICWGTFMERNSRKRDFWVGKKNEYWRLILTGSQTSQTP